MKFAHFTKNSAGIGLVEVLVATLVVAVGLLAVASLQGDLIGGSRNNKTRAECQTLANTKMEELRDTIENSGYTALASSTSNESIAGVTDTFNRWWLVTDETSPVRKRVRVKVCWADGCNATNPNLENRCVVQSVIAFNGVGNSVLAAKGSGAGTGNIVGGPSLNAESSDEITESIVLPSAATPGSVTTFNGKTYIVQDNGLHGSRADLCSGYTPALTAFEIETNLRTNLYTRRVNYDAVAGDEAIELYEQVVAAGSDYCIPRVRYNGGVIIPIRGTVYSPTAGLSVSLFTFNATESGTYCVFKPVVNATSAPYVCYVGGNCQGYTGTTSMEVTSCPGSIAAAKEGAGGWRGKVGLLGVAVSSGNDGKNVCFAEEVAGTPVTLDSGRNYYTRNAGLNEGINKPYNCHDFLIIDGQTTEARVHTECLAKTSVISAISGFQSLASKTIQRDLLGANIFDPITDITHCPGSSSHTLVVTLTGASPISGGMAVIPASGTGNCIGSGTSYTCTVPNGIVGSLTFTGMAGLNSCTGTSSYSASSSTQTVTLPITSCTTAASCSWTGGTVTNSSSVTAWLAATVPYGSTCVSQLRTCNLGALLPLGYDYTSCAVLAGASCNINGVTVASGSSVMAYLSAAPTAGCVSESRTCTNGTPSGTYTNSSCIAGCSATISGSANNKNDYITANGAACAVASNKNITCPTISNLANGTAISVVSTGSVNVTKTVTVACPATAYTVNF